MKKLSLITLGLLLGLANACHAATYQFRLYAHGVVPPVQAVAPPSFVPSGAVLVASTLAGHIPTMTSDLTMGAVSNAVADAQSSVGHSTGSWYFEVTLNAGGYAGVEAAPNAGGNPPGLFANSAGYNTNGGLYSNGANLEVNNKFAAPRLMGVAVNAATGVATFYDGCNIFASASFGTGNTVFAAVGLQGASSVATINFGATPFSCAVPNGYQPGW